MMGWLTPHRAGPTGHQHYRSYQCGLCHALGARHGFVSRIAAGPDLVAFQVFLDVVAGVEAPLSARPCVLSVTGRALPMRQATAHTDIAADFGLWMGVEKARDDWRDEGRLLGWLAAAVLREPGEQARLRLAAQGFPVDEVRAALDQQARLEALPHAPIEQAMDATRQVGRLAFGFAARQHPERRAAAEQVGDALATWLFWVDGLLDWPRDLSQGRYNPLARSLQGPAPATPPADLHARALAEAHAALDRLDQALGALRGEPSLALGPAYLRAVLVLGPRDRLHRLAALVPSPRATARDLLPPRPSPLPRLRAALTPARLRAALQRLPARARRGRLAFRLQATVALALAWAFPGRTWAQQWWPTEPLPVDTGALELGAALDAGDTGAALDPGDPGAADRARSIDDGAPVDACTNNCGFCDFETCCADNCVDPCCGPVCEEGIEDSCTPDCESACESAGDSGA